MQGIRELNLAAALLAETRARVATGKRVASPRDSGAAWSIARTTLSQVRNLDVAKASLARGLSITDVAIAAGESVLDLLGDMHQLALAAADASLDATSRNLHDQAFRALRDRVGAVVSTATFDGVNLVGGGAQDISVIADVSVGVPAAGDGAGGGDNGGDGNGNGGGNGNGNGNNGNGGGNGNGNGGNGNGGSNGNGNGNGGGWNGASAGNGSDLAVERLTLTAESLSLGGPVITLAANAVLDSSASAASVAGALEASIGAVSRAVGRLGASINLMERQLGVVSRRQARLEAGIGHQVDADVIREKARVLALETRLTLATSVLSMANAMPGRLLALFAPATEA